MDEPRFPQVDLGRLAASVDPDSRGGRVGVDSLSDAIRRQRQVAGVDLPQLTLDVIVEGERQGWWKPAQSVTVTRGNVRMPKYVTLPATSAGETLRPIERPLRLELRWAVGLPLSAAQREVVERVSDWLRSVDGSNVAWVDVAERSYEILGHEKALSSRPGGEKLWGEGRLSWELLRCRRTATPLTWEPVGDVVVDGGTVVCVENHATFRTLLRAARELNVGGWVAVAWVQGRNTAPLASLSDLPFRVDAMEYLGDLDADGLAIARAACQAAEAAGVPAGPCGWLWDLLVVQPSRAGGSAPADVDVTVAWLPEQVRADARALLAAGRMIPQEAIRYDVLASAGIR